MSKSDWERLELLSISSKCTGVSSDTLQCHDMFFWNQLAVALFYAHPIEYTILKSGLVTEVGDRIVPSLVTDKFALDVPSDASKFDSHETKFILFDFINLYCFHISFLKGRGLSMLYSDLLSRSLHARWNAMSLAHCWHSAVIEIHLTVALFYVRPIQVFTSATH